MHIKLTQMFDKHAKKMDSQFKNNILMQYLIIYEGE